MTTFHDTDKLANNGKGLIFYIERSFEHTIR